MTFFDISCPVCGPFRALRKRATKTCPECGSPHAILLEHSYEIDDRLRSDKEEHRRMLQED